MCHIAHRFGQHFKMQFSLMYGRVSQGTPSVFPNFLCMFKVNNDRSCFLILASVATLTQNCVYDMTVAIYGVKIRKYNLLSHINGDFEEAA